MKILHYENTLYETIISKLSAKDFCLKIAELKIENLKSLQLKKKSLQLPNPWY